MKSIKNKKTEIVNADAEGKPMGTCNYSDLINIAIRQGKQGGFDYADMESRLAIAKATKEAEGAEEDVIQLEDTHFNYLKKLVMEMRWGFYHADLIAFRDDLAAVK